MRQRTGIEELTKWHARSDKSDQICPPEVRLAETIGRHGFRKCLARVKRQHSLVKSSATAHPNLFSSMTNSDTIIVVHGTFASESSWWRHGSTFCRKLDSRLEQLGVDARCWSGIEHESLQYQWTGRNSETARTLAAQKLATRIENFISNNPGKKIHFVAHSHGGNVVIKTLSGSGQRGSIMFGELSNVVRSVTLLGTPLLEYESLREGISLRIFNQTILGIAILFAGSSFIILSLSPVPFTLFNFFAPLLPSAIITANIVLAGEHRKKHKLANLPTPTKFFNIYSRYDEAISLLKHCDQLGKKISVFDYPQSKNYYLISGRVYFVNTFITSEEKHIPPHLAVILLIRYCLSPSEPLDDLYGPRIVTRIFRHLLLPAVFPVALLLFVDWNSGKVVSFFRRGMRKFAIRAGLKAIGRNAIGDDSPLDRVRSVEPSGGFFNKINRVLIPKSVDEALLESTTREFGELTRRIYQEDYLRSNYGQIFDTVRNVLQDAQLVHSQYYCNDWCINKIAEVIMQNISSRSEI